MLLRRRKRKYHDSEIDPDEIFLDSKNLPQFNVHQLEGAIERPIEKQVFTILALVFVVVGLVFFVQLIFLQIGKGKTYFAQSEQNRLYEIALFGDRGVVYDRYGEDLAWNVQPTGDEPFSYRAYIHKPGFAHVLGYIGYPKKDTSGFYWRKELEGKEGIEALYNDTLSGTPGTRLVEVDALGTIVSSGQVVAPQNGENITLSIDAGMQETLHNALREMTRQFGYIGGTAAVMDIYTGELLTLTSYPEFDPSVMSLGQDVSTIEGYFKNSATPMIDRAVSGLYTPGSIVKPFVALAALQEGVVTPETQVMSTGYIEIPNPYDSTKPTRFYDWRWSRFKTGHGATDVYHAIADSVNTYFYAVGGGYKNQKGIGIMNIKKYLSKFKIGEPTGIALGGEKTGVIPDPEWKKQQFKDGTWRVGDTYNTVIGQFGVQVTPLQMLRATAAIASDGILVTPQIEKDAETKREVIEGIDQKWYKVVRDAMRKTVTEGTAQTLNVSFVHVAVKSGTAQTNGNTKINAWVEGFFPYEAPRYAFVIMAEGAPSNQGVGSVWAAYQWITWMRDNHPEYFETH